MQVLTPDQLKAIGHPVNVAEDFVRRPSNVDEMIASRILKERLGIEGGWDALEEMPTAVFVRSGPMWLLRRKGPLRHLIKQL